VMEHDAFANNEQLALKALTDVLHVVKVRSSARGTFAHLDVEVL
jgi:hypothetical protein